MPTGVELYGHTAGLGETTLARIEAGFDTIREYEGWENFRIPAYVWEFIDSDDRDWILNWVEASCFTRRSDPIAEGVTQAEVMAYMYAVMLYLEWWRDNPDRPYGEAIHLSMSLDMGIPWSAFGTLTKDSVRYWFASLKHPSEVADVRINYVRFNYGYNPGVGGLRWGAYCEAKGGAGTNHVMFENAYDGDVMEYRNYMRDTAYPEQFYYHYNTAWDDAGDEAEWWGDIEIPESVFGVNGPTCGLSDTQKSRLLTGLSEIRAVEGWEGFRLPDQAWQYVGQRERDRILTWLQEALWDNRPDGLENGVSREMHLAFCYALFVVAEWWRDDPERIPFTFGEGILSGLCNIPLSAISLGYSSSVRRSYSIEHPSGVETLKISDVTFYDATSNVFSLVTAGSITGELEYFTGIGYYGFSYLWDEITDEEDYDADWDDEGVIADWSDCDEGGTDETPILANGEHEVLSGRASFKSFGLMDGEVSLNVALDVGDTLTVARGDTPLLTGVVTNVRADLVEGTYAHEIADPVTSQSGEVEYTSGNAITAMQDAIEACGGTFETEMETEETVFYPESPVDAWQFFRAVSYAVGGVLQYGRDGVYRLVEGGSGHSVTDSMIIGDDRPTTEERTKDYANRVAASIDQEWRTPAVEPTNDIFSGGGATANITRLGEQITSQSVEYGDSTSIENSYSYDENNYLVYKKIEEDGEDYARLTKVTFSGISEDGNNYTVTEEETFYTKMMVPDGIGGLKSETVPEEKTTKTFVVDLNGVASVEEIYENRWPSWIGAFPFIPDPDNWLNLWQQTKWYGVIVLKPSSGPLEGYTTAKQYNYVHNGFKMDGGNIVPTVGWVQAKCASKSWSVPKLEVYAPEDTHEVHILAKAEDPDAITALGEHEYECQAVSLDTETGMQAFALGVLYEKGRIRHANVSVPNDDYLSGDSVIWRGLEWQIDTVTVDLDRCSDIIEMVTTSTLARLQNSISREPVSWIEDVKNVVTKRTGLYDNVSRGRILSQVGFRRYLVQAEGKASPVEAKALTDEPHLVGGSALLVRPSGKGQPWTLLSLSKEQEIAMPETVTAKVTPAMDDLFGLIEFTADFTDPIPEEDVTLSWDFAIPAGWSFSRVVVDDGTGSTSEITEEETKSDTVSYVRDDGTSFTPSITLYLLDANSQEIELEPRALDNGPLLLNYLNLSVTPDWDEPWTGLEVTFSFLKTKTGSSALTVTSLKARADSADEWDSLETTDTSVGYEYETDGSYTMQVELIYENSREETETLLVDVPVEVWAVPENVSYNSGTGNWEASFPVDGAFDETWAAGDIGTDAPFIEGVADLADAKGIGGKALGFTLSFGVAGTGVSTGKYTEVRLGVHRKYRPDSKYGETEYTNYKFTEYGFPIPVFTFFQVETHADGLRAWAGYRLGDNYRKWVGPIILDTPSYPATIDGVFKVVYTAPDGGNGSMNFYWNDSLKGSKVMYTTGTQQLFNWNYGSVYVANPVPADARLFTVITRAQSGLALTGDVRLIIPSKDLSIAQDWEEFLLPGGPKEFVWVNPY